MSGNMHLLSPSLLSPRLRMESGCRISHGWRGYEPVIFSKFRIYPYLSCWNYIRRPFRRSREEEQLLQRTAVAGFRQSSSSSSNAPILADCFRKTTWYSHQEDHPLWQACLDANLIGGIVALGKFDALHIGHRELAIQASKAGAPFLLSFVGMAEVLGWEHRAPIVAKCDRKQVLSSWAPYCGNVVPLEFHVQFSSVRHLTPRQFVERLSKELKVNGVVAGENYRFGYKASGDASELVRLCKDYGLGAFIVNSIMDKNQCSSDGRSKSCDLKERGQVSSTRVRYALAEGDMKYVSELLGRRHRLMLMLSGDYLCNGNRIAAPRSSMLNQPPREGVYENCSLLIDHVFIGPCRVFIGATDIHLEFDGGEGTWAGVPFQGCQILGIEFGDNEGN